MDYFRDLEERENVKIFVTDMYKPYAEPAKIYFRNAKTVIDKYHYYRQVNWAMERVRKRIQKEQRPQERKLLKGNRRLLSKTPSSLKTEEWPTLERMLALSEELYKAWLLKEEFLLIRNSKNNEKGRGFLTKWLRLARSFNLREFDDCIRAFANWFEYILNSLDTPYTNGFEEGKNNRIKALKRNAYGVQNFERFRKRILLSC